MKKERDMRESKLKVGMKVTVYEWEPYPSGVRDRSYVGEVMEIKAIDHPFVVVERLEDRILNRPMTLDLRMVTLHALSKKFINEALANYEAKGEKT
jgi:hypothetical protein